MFIAIDPGEMCGTFAISETGKIMGCFEAPPFETVRWVDRKCHAAESAGSITVVVERYEITMQTLKNTRQYAALETLGALRYVAQDSRQLFTTQSRSARMRVSNNVLKKLMWYSITEGGHVNDAARHAWIIYAKTFPNSDLVKSLLEYNDL